MIVNCFVHADVVRCEVMNGWKVGIYVISSCPADYTENSDVIEACDTDSKYDDVIHRIPVSGDGRIRSAGRVYRNIHCAVCHGEPNSWFWLVAMSRQCEAGSRDDGCRLAFHPPSVPIPLRTCLRYTTSACPDDDPESSTETPSVRNTVTRNTSLAARCRQAAASFVTDGRRVFRNRYCARCSSNDNDDVDEARLPLRCVQVPSFSSSSVPVLDSSRYDVVYDLNAGRRRDLRTGSSSAVGLQCDDTKVYDPLLADCVPLPYCTTTSSRCRLRRTARLTSPDCPTGLLAINSSNHVRYENGSVFVLSLRTLFDADECRRCDNDTIYVCVDVGRDQSSTRSVTLFATMHDFQRLVSVVATVVGLLALVALLSSHCLPGHPRRRRRDHSGKMTFCFVLSVALYHAAYLAVLAGSMHALIPATHLQLASLVVCAGMQYFVMASFFWLHVLSIEAYRAVRVWCSTDLPNATSCTALLVYSLYAWTVPALVVGWSTALPLLHITAPPIVSESSCCVLGVLQLLLLVVPCLVSLIIDLVLYVLTALLLCRHHTSQHYDAGFTDTLLPDRHSPKVDTQWTTRSWSAERLRAEKSAADAAARRWTDIYVTCIQTSLLLAATWTLCLLPATGWVDWPSVLWYVYVALDFALLLTVCLSWCSVDRVWHVLATRKLQRLHEDEDAAAAVAAAGGRGRVAAAAPGGRRTPPAFNDSTSTSGAAASLRLLMRETSI